MEQIPNGVAPVTWRELLAGKGELAERPEHFHTAVWRAKS
jgi:hypothetical protein